MPRSRPHLADAKDFLSFKSSLGNKIIYKYERAYEYRSDQNSKKITGNFTP
jgi:hypothetical protein